MIINNKYSVKLLKNIRNDDIKSVFKSQSVLYIVNFPDNEWHLKHGINEICSGFSVLLCNAWLHEPCDSGYTQIYHIASTNKPSVVCIVLLFLFCFTLRHM